MSRLGALAGVVILSVVPLAGQAGPATPADGQSMVRAAGMALPDGTLATGVLTVRIVRGAFTEDVVGVPVDVDVDGDVAAAADGAQTRQAVTSAQGRAEFAHVPIGARVHASATVDGRRLESEAFMMPAQGGIRVLLVVAEPGDASSSHAVAAGPAAMPAALPPMSTRPSRSTMPDESGADVVRLIMIMLTAGVVIVLVARRYRQRQG